MSQQAQVVMAFTVMALFLMAMLVVAYESGF